MSPRGVAVTRTDALPGVNLGSLMLTLVGAFLSTCHIKNQLKMF